MTPSGMRPTNSGVRYELLQNFDGFVSFTHRDVEFNHLKMASLGGMVLGRSQTFMLCCNRHTVMRV